MLVFRQIRSYLEEMVVEGYDNGEGVSGWFVFKRCRESLVITKVLLKEDENGRTDLNPTGVVREKG